MWVDSRNFKRQENEFSQKGMKPCCMQKGFQPNETPVGLLISSTTKEYMCVVLSHQLCGNLLWQKEAAANIWSHGCSSIFIDHGLKGLWSDDGDPPEAGFANLFPPKLCVHLGYLGTAFAHQAHLQLNQDCTFIYNMEGLHSNNGKAKVLLQATP